MASCINLTLLENTRKAICLIFHKFAYLRNALDVMMKVSASSGFNLAKKQGEAGL